MPLAVDRYELGPLRTNCYVVRSERGATECAVIDPGGDAADLRLELARLGTSSVGILITHGHFDHLGGVADLAEGTGAEVWMPEGSESGSSANRNSRRSAYPVARTRPSTW